MANAIYEAEKAIYPQAKAQQTLQQQEIAAQMGMQGMRMFDDMRKNQAILVEQTNPNKIIDDILLTLQGFEKNEDGALKKVSDPVINELGLSRFRLSLRAVINQNTILSHLEKEDIGRLMVNLSQNIGDELELNWKDYGIIDKTLLDTIKDAVLLPAFLALKRAEGQNEKNWLSKISFENLNNAPTIKQPKKESWLSKFKI